MIKDLKVALGLGAGFWAIMFIGVAALMFTPMPEILQRIGGIILAGVAAFILAKIYFKKNLGDIKDGVILGVLWLVVSTILDLLITIQYIKAGGSYVDGLKMFYGTWNLWVGFLLMIGGTILAAKMTHGGELTKQVAPSNKGGAPQQPASAPGGVSAGKPSRQQPPAARPPQQRPPQRPPRQQPPQQKPPAPRPPQQPPAAPPTAPQA